MNSPGGGTVHVSAPSVALGARRSPPSLQRTPFAIQELLGLEPPRPASLYAPAPAFQPAHHHMTMAASRMAYFNAQAAVAAAFLPQHAPLSLHGAPPGGESLN